MKNAHMAHTDKNRLLVNLINIHLDKAITATVCKGLKTLLFHPGECNSESIEDNLYSSFTREAGYQLSPTWKIIHAAKQQRGCRYLIFPQIPCQIGEHLQQLHEEDSPQGRIPTYPPPLSKHICLLKLLSSCFFCHIPVETYPQPKVVFQPRSMPLDQQYRKLSNMMPDEHLDG
jgi:hypothetical protein